MKLGQLGPSRTGHAYLRREASKANPYPTRSELSDKVRVTIFGDFAEDGRLSMDLYATSLAAALRNLPSARYEIKEYHPRMIRIGGSGPMRMRLSRYVGYPLSSRLNAGALNHVIDPGYGHLLYTLDRRRTVVTVHDVIPIARFLGGIRGLSPQRRPLLNQLSFGALWRAAHIIADSENTKRNLVSLLGCASANVTVVHPGLDPLFRAYPSEERLQARQRLGLSKGVYLLVTGSADYKNHIGALRAFALLRCKFTGPCYLLKTGGVTQQWSRAVAELGLEGHVRALGIVERESLLDLYNSVDCLLFPSLYEGFGWPPLEAMACGTPVVASNAASLPEVVGDAGIMVPPWDSEGMAEALYRVLTNPALRDSLVRMGLERAQNFCWDGAARQIERVYDQVLAA